MRRATISSLPGTTMATALAAILALGAAGCEGDEGPQGPAGSPGTQGPPGAPGEPAVLDPSLSGLDKAYAAVGGAEALAALQGFSYASKGSRFSAGEGFLPLGEPVEVASFENRIAADIANDLWRFDRNTKVEFIFVPNSLSYSEIIRDNVGVIAGNDILFGRPTENRAIESSRLSATLREAMLLNPLVILSRLQADEAMATEIGVDLVNGRVHHVLEVEDQVAPIHLFVDAAYGHISKIETMTSDFLLGDLEVEVVFADVRPDAMGFPEVAIMSVDGDLLQTETRSDITVNGDLDAGLFAFPDDLDGQPQFNASLAERGSDHHHLIATFDTWGIPILEIPQNRVALVTEVGGEDTGVHHLIGGTVGVEQVTGTHHTVVVDQGDSVVVLEPPLEEAWGEAVVAWIGENLRDGDDNPKPISHVIVSHHHDDHSGSTRRFAAEGAQIVVGKGGGEFMKKALAADFTINPDVYSQRADTLDNTIVEVGDEPLLIGNGTNDLAVISTVVDHAGDMVTTRVSLPSGAAFFVADVYNPGPPVDAEGNALPLDFNDRALWSRDLQNQLLNLSGGLAAQNTDIMIGAHGVATYDDPRVVGEDASFVTFADFVGQVDASLE